MRRRRRGSLAETRRFWTPDEDRRIRALPLAKGRGQAKGVNRPYVETGALQRLAAELGRSADSISTRRLRLLKADAAKPKIVYRISDEARRQWQAFPAIMAAALDDPPRFRSVSRPCSACGRTFNTTRQRRLLCAGCFKGRSDLVT